ncbi:MAG: PQQ-binding-like beta-propeller repeat protein [Thermoleophilia bacterium]|nr:PQQ-binding-like beta-propeller repeat protein [Thermoleophilia bacterium]
MFKRNAAAGPQTRWWRGATAVAIVVVSALGVTACGSKDNTAGDAGTPATFPAFSSAQLNKLPTENWITNGGTLRNDRYSPLDQINDTNVTKVKGDWMADLQSGTEAKYSHEEQPIVYNGVLYVPTGEDDVFAFDVKTGKQKWKYEGNLDENISTVCCGWLSRGVAIGEGNVYIGKLDGHMVALDQDTGKQVWDTEVVNWKKENGGITAAPLYYDGRIYTGITGGEYGVRGKLVALDAKTGKEDWKFYTTAGPEADAEFSKTWAGDSALTGGAPIWQTPSVDPKLGMLYFTTGNANPDVDGSARAGDNLFAASFVALDAKTGAYKWHYQTTHHDIWDYDQPSPTLLYDAKIDGKTVPVVAEAGKTGWLYALDRRTGEPVWPIEETPVAQNAQQKTSATQPLPQYEPFSDHDVSDAEFNSVVKLVKGTPEGKNLKAVRGTGPANSVWQPSGPGTMAVIANGATGGTNWQPSSYNHKTHLIYVCSTNGVEGIYPSGVAARVEGDVRIGSILAALPFNTPGRLSAIDADTGKITWAVDFPTSCYSGSVTTAGNLVFVGNSDGHLEAYSADAGKKLWGFQLGAGANSTVTVFESEGKQKLAIVAGGNSLAASPHGDNLWVLSLDGKLDQLTSTDGTKAAGEHAGETTSNDTTKDKAASDGTASDTSTQNK